MALVFLATQSVVPCRHNEGVLDRHRPRLTNRKSSKPNHFSSSPRISSDVEQLDCPYKLRSPSVDDALCDDAFFAKDDIDINKRYISDDDDEDDEDFRTNFEPFCNNNNDLNFNLNKLRKPADSYLGSSVEAFPSSLIKWPLNNGSKSKRLSDIRKQVKHLSKAIKMTIDSDDEQSPKGQSSNPAPFSSHVDMNLLRGVPSASSSKPLPSIEAVESVLRIGKGKEIKSMLRHSNWSMDHTIRKYLWITLVQRISKEPFSDFYYWETVQQMYGSKDLSGINIVLPTFVEHNHVKTYGLSTEGIKACERVIAVLAYNHPDTTYAPIVYPLAALFMHYMEEPDVFNCLNALLTASSSYYISQTRISHETLWRTVDSLAQKHAKGSYSLLNKIGITNDQKNEGFQKWTWWLFTKLPFSHLIRIIDCFLYEGNKVLLRSSLGLFHLLMRMALKDSNLVATLTTKGLCEAMAGYCTNIQSNNVSPSKLLIAAFGIRALSKNGIKKIMSQIEESLKKDPNFGGTSGVGSLLRSASLENLPSSESQENVQATSHTMNIRELLTIWNWIPMRVTMSHPRLIYTTEEHGSSLTNFYLRVEKFEPTLLLVRTLNDEVFGAYCSAAWEQRKFRDEYGHKQTYFGTGETFLFTLKPEVKRYDWIGITRQRANRELASVPHQSELFMHADNDMITVGGGQGHGLMLDHDLQYGKTERCDTFNNDPLCASSDFEIKVVEVFHFSDSS